MDHHPSRDAELLALYPPGQHPIIDRAERAIRAFHIVTRDQARRALAMWAHAHTLTPDQAAAVLARFRDTDVEHVDRVSRCRRCGHPGEHITGVLNPFWRHLEPAGRPHGFEPKDTP